MADSLPGRLAACEKIIKQQECAIEIQNRLIASLNDKADLLEKKADALEEINKRLTLMNDHLSALCDEQQRILKDAGLENQQVNL